MSVNVKNGTPIHGPSLCETCVHAHIGKGFRVTEQFVVCCLTYPVHQVNFPLRECSDYRQMGRQSLKEMQDMAWILVPRGPKRRAGFIHVSELVNEEGEIELKLDATE